ncbi:MAG: heme ABC exporter ATP-binding protein CcmA [Rhodobacteraceae bacterium]|nr:heme ABC exporter ATP-binding protein CcmA [Paracoccaceae bacterium]
MRLNAHNLAIRRNGRDIVSSVSFQLSGGTALIITGPNGAGKSTLLRAMAGLLPFAGGTIELIRNTTDDQQADDRPLFEHCHYVGHASGVKPSLSVEENLALWHDLMDPVDWPSDTSSGMPQHNHSTMDVETVLDHIGLSHIADFPASYLSEGQTQRLSLARLLVTQRPIWLLDEPTAALDQASTKLVTDLMNTHLAKGGMILVATHIDLELSNRTALSLGAIGEPS